MTASQLEVDFVLGAHEVAVEVKGTANTQPHHFRGLAAFGKEYQARSRILVSCDPRPRLTEQGIEILPWRVFLESLWSNRIIKLSMK